LDDLSRALNPPRPVIRFLDGLRRIVAIEQQLSDHTARAEYDYDALGRIARVRPPGDGETRLTFDLLGRQLVEESPATGRTFMVVDASGNQVSRTNAAGQTVENVVDALDRLVEVRQEGNADPEFHYTYFDSGMPTPIDGIANRIGRVWHVDDALGRLELSYDAF